VVLVAVVLLVGLGAWAYSAYQEHVVVQPGEHILRDAILQVISQESPVFYNDGRSRIGVFFAHEHREYVPYQRIPKACIDALTSSEDKRYFEHSGIDLFGISRAMLKNIQAGRVVAGGSSLTQQTAKNLYYRPDRSFRSKWTELVNALRLEAHHSKEDILEYYFNQFHVSGNGRGIGIAARYFFNTAVDDLGPLECAFLAGMVKAPAYYNPFIKRSDEAKQKAIEKAESRVDYVLSRMLDEGALDAELGERLLATPIPFERGTFRYARSVVLDAVEERLTQAPFPALFTELGIENPSTAGLQIVTTLDHDAQRAATYGLWHHLTELGGYLESATVDDFLLPASKAPSNAPNQDFVPRDFYVGQVQRVDGDGDQRTLWVGLGGDAGCRVDQEAVGRVAKMLARSAQKKHRVSANAESRAAVFSGLSKGAVLRVSLREVPRDGELLCDPELRPELQGAVVVLNEGRLLAMVGGNDNQHFNRATSAQRQFGSTWKPLVYLAALQLGWLPDDALDNRRAVFPFEGTWYYPRPDHTPEDWVSMAWAGTRSENLASIWLMFHLFDRLNEEQFRQVAELTDMARRKNEDRRAYIRRIRDTMGVIALESRTEEVLFELARRDVIDGLAFSAHPEDGRLLQSLHYGRGFEKERAKVRKEQSGTEREARLQALDRSFLRLEKLSKGCRGRYARLQAARTATEPVALDSLTGIWVRPSSKRLDVACGSVAPDGYAALTPHFLETLSHPLMPAFAPVGSMLVEGVLHLETVAAVRRALDTRRTEFDGVSPWDEALLYLHPDFRRMMAIRYVSGLARALGVDADLPPVLSLPLGAADLTLTEAASLYQGFVSGKSYRIGGERYADSPVPGIRSRIVVPAGKARQALIQEIRDVNGNVLYRVKPEAHEVARPEDAALVGGILRRVVQWGTGRRAKSALTLGGKKWPLTGKTGTTNAFRNSAFSGVVPVEKDATIRWDEGIVIASYVGYDDNRSMKKGTLRVSGATGALPAWISTAQGLADAGLLGPGRVKGDPEPFFGNDVIERVVDGAGLPTDVVEWGVDTPTLLSRPSTSRNFAPYKVPKGSLPPSVWDAIEAEG